MVGGNIHNLNGITNKELVAVKFGQALAGGYAMLFQFSAQHVIDEVYAVA